MKMHTTITRHIRWLCSGLLVLTVLAGGMPAQAFDEPDTEPPVVHQDERAARAADIALLAQEAGLPLERVARAIAFQESFGAYAEDLLNRYPDQISAVWMEPVPNTRGHIQFTAEMPADATTALGAGGVLSPDNVVLTGHGAIAQADHSRRAQLAAMALVDLGYHNMATFYDPRVTAIQIELQLPAGIAPPRTADLVGPVQNRVRADKDQSGNPRFHDRAAIVTEQDLNLTVLMGAGPFLTEENHIGRGGNWLRDDGGQECTSGWSVIGPDGYGIITAAHCTGLNEIELTDGTVYSTEWKSQEYGLLGDVEYHTTGTIEEPEFYADSNTTRAVTGIKGHPLMLGGSVCRYGRASNYRTCYHTVDALLVTVSPSPGVLVGSLIRTDSTSSTFGDSGGGWYWGNTAWGVHHGRDSLGRGYFTPIDQALLVLNVGILT